ncbi:helix-turn-helix domain-containing protein [Xenorhabdus bovienii]|uniref:helix-turn-helix domain-containing protein n=1 Tax=Xenorhabdus bovienii TaxID=40576 RepID=UPI0023B3232F|nr:helix-turn-helix domain-containing protein [Xenorhabdus bovienii]MDE9493716.1 helix-turn-helix domain-containing protein [Xenorhabdus bovienii]MDE9502253.1 helix-turn-helix domain-containing protein [Xenorhabdus bovienii]MDE9526061.1 helix-turn-helix domain-containing protein [Xenorhabdus bovienii]MDE9569501.1 helix-turn-helix domain-containing protein [Xenorhabdus bovienii]
MPILPPISRNERRQMKKMAQKTQNKKFATRILTILMVYQGKSVYQIAEELCTAQSSVLRWIKRFKTYGWGGLQSQPAGRHRRWNLTYLLPLITYLT